MNNKRVIAVIAVLMAVLMLFGLVASVIPAKAYAVSQSDIDALQQKKNELSDRVEEAQDRLGGLREQENSVLAEKAALEERNQAAQEQLDVVDQEIRMYDEMIEDKAEELAQAQQAEQAQLDRYRVRVRAMEENGGYNILVLLLHSASFSDFLALLDDTSKIMESDKKLEHAYREARIATEKVKAEYEELRADCLAHQEELRQEQEEIRKGIDEALATLESLADEIAAAQEKYEAEMAEENAAAQELTALIAQYEEQKRREAEAEAARRAAEEAARREAEAAANPVQQDNPAGETPSDDSNSGGDNSSGDNTGGGDVNTGNGDNSWGLGGGNAVAAGYFTWPVPCSSRVTSRCGYRIDPFTGVVTGHSGIDIDGYGNDGQPIVAAASGTVIVATNSGGYGNYVTIDHGNGYSTVYAHMSGLAVGYGQWVEAGTVVGYLGSTGRSTGTHCHFEIRENGTPIDPEQFFSGLSHWNC